MTRRWQSIVLSAAGPLSSSARLVGLAISVRAGDRGQASVRADELAHDTALSERTVWAALAELREHGFLPKNGRRAGRLPNTYELVIPKDTAA